MKSGGFDTKNWRLRCHCLALASRARRYSASYAGSFDNCWEILLFSVVIIVVVGVVFDDVVVVVDCGGGGAIVVVVV